MLFTRPGIAVGLHLLNTILPGELSFTNVHGRLFDQFTIHGLSYIDKNQTITSQKIQCHWHPSALLSRHLAVETLRIDGLKQQTKPDAPSSPPAVESSQSKPFSMPISVAVDSLTLYQASIDDTLITKLSTRLSLSTAGLRLSQFQVHAMNQSVDGQLTLGLSSPKLIQGQFNLSSPSLLNGHVTLGGSIDALSIQLKIAKPFEASGLIVVKDLQTLQTNLHWSGLKWPLNNQPFIHSSQGHLTANGNIEHFQLELNTDVQSFTRAHLQLQVNGTPSLIRSTLKASLLNGHLNANGQLQRKTQQITLSKLSLNQLDLSALSIPISQLNASANGVFNDTGHYDFSLNSQALFNQSRLSLQGKLNAKLTKLKAVLGDNWLKLNGAPPYRWQINGQITQWQALSPALKGLKLPLKLQGKTESPSQGRLNIRLSSGQYSLPDNHIAKAIQLIGGAAEVVLDSAGLSINGQVNTQQAHKIHFNATLPKLQLNKIQQDQPLNAQMTIKGLQLNMLDDLFGQTKNTQGQLDTQLTLSGQFSNLIPQLTLQLVNASTTIPALNLALNPIQLKLKLDSQQWLLNGQLSSNGSKLALNGKGKLNQHKLIGNLSLQGNQFKLIDSEEYQIFISPDLNIALNANGVIISGNVTIPKANIAPHDFTSTLEMPDEVVYVGETQQTTTPSQSGYDVSVKLGDAVKFSYAGLSGLLAGQLRVSAREGQATSAIGTILFKEGQFNAYGQKLKIDRGELIYTGGIIDNPGISVRASRTLTLDNNLPTTTRDLVNFEASNLSSSNLSGTVRVGVDVSGRLRSPKVTLFSDPSNLTQADILSLLLLGRPAHQAGEGGAGLLMGAVSSLQLGSGSSGAQLTDQLKNALGFDVNLKTETKYDAESNTASDSTSMVLGKSLSSRLYVSYKIGILGSDESMLLIKYLLNRFFTLQINAGLKDSGADLYYSYHKE